MTRTTHRISLSMPAIAAAMLSIVVICSSAWAQAPQPRPFDVDLAQVTGTGKSLDDPFVIKGVPDHEAGMFVEYAIVGKMFPGSTVVSQKLMEKDGRRFDILDVKCADLVVRPVHFDVTGFWGKGPSDKK